MNFKAHLAAGAVTGAAVATVALAAGFVDTIGEAGALAALGTGFALFPDLDTASIPQRWFYRGMAAAIVALILTGRWQSAALLGLVALLPLLHHHRGWTHRWWAVPLVPLGALALWRSLAVGGEAWGGSDPLEAARSLWGFLEAHLPAYGAMTAGYAVHLIADRLRAGR
ncbi:MAG: metal-dependent hydrolase [SAR324 cluster bacterium]|nr:metal-dependent hydrolase [SAR324 cluster bacterium]